MICNALAANPQIFTVIFTVNLSGIIIDAGLRPIRSEVTSRDLLAPTMTADTIDARPSRSENHRKSAGIIRPKLLSQLIFLPVFLPSRRRPSGAVESLNHGKRDLNLSGLNSAHRPLQCEPSGKICERRRAGEPVSSCTLETTVATLPSWPTAPSGETSRTSVPPAVTGRSSIEDGRRQFGQKRSSTKYGMNCRCSAEPAGRVMSKTGLQCVADQPLTRNPAV
jgi:hypothetical protein